MAQATCPVCCVDVRRRSPRGPAPQYCSLPCKQYARKARAEGRSVLRPVRATTCPVCAAVLQRRAVKGPFPTYCSNACKLRAWRAKNQGRALDSADYRASRWGVDDGTCPRCGKACGPDDRYAKGRVCKTCSNAAARAVALANPERTRRSVRRANLKRMYGLTPEDVDEMVLAQEGRCWTCERPSPLHIDHCHDSGRVRKLLCVNCNQALGKVFDDVATLERMIAYLKEHAAQS